MNTKQNVNEPLPASDLGFWRWLHEERPDIGDLIVCCAPHYKEGVIYFAGLVTEKHGQFDVMVTGAKGVDERSFIITHDTQWMRVNKPNDQALPEAGHP